MSASTELVVAEAAAGAEAAAAEAALGVPAPGAEHGPQQLLQQPKD